MKKMIFGAGMILLASGAYAQKINGLNFSVGAELGVATGNLNTQYSLVTGATAQLDYKIQHDVALTLNSGVIDFIGKKISNTNLKYQSTAAIPFLAGVKYYFAPKVYGAAQLGATVFTAKGVGSLFTYAPGVGYKIDEKWDLLVKYTGYSSKSYGVTTYGTAYPSFGGGAFGIRLGYTLK